MASLITSDEQQALNRVFQMVIQEMGFRPESLASLGLGDLLAQISGGAGLAFPLTNGTSTNTYTSAIANGSTAVGHDFNTSLALSTAGSKIARFRNNGVEKLYVDKDGVIGTPTSTATGLTISSGYSGTADDIGMIFAQPNNPVTSRDRAWLWTQGGFSVMGLRADIFNSTTLILYDGQSSGVLAQITATPGLVSFKNGGGSPVDLYAGSVFPLADVTHTLGTTGDAYKEVWARVHAGVHLDSSTSGAVSIDSQAGETQVLTSTGNVTSLAITGGKAGQTLVLELVQGNGSHTWPTTITNARLSGGSFTKTATVSSVNMMQFRYNATAAKWDQVGQTTLIS